MQPRVLVVDDDDVVANAVRAALSGYDVTAVASPLEALERVHGGERFDLVVCDVYMPDLNGPDLAHELAKVDASFGTRILFLTEDAEASSGFLSHPVLS